MLTLPTNVPWGLYTSFFESRHPNFAIFDIWPFMKGKIGSNAPWMSMVMYNTILSNNQERNIHIDECSRYQMENIFLKWQKMGVILKFGEAFFTYKIMKTLLSGILKVSKYSQPIWLSNQMTFRTTHDLMWFPEHYLLPLPPNSHLTKNSNILQDISSFIHHIYTMADFYFEYALWCIYDTKLIHKICTSPKSHIAQLSVHFLGAVH